MPWGRKLSMTIAGALLGAAALTMACRCFWHGAAQERRVPGALDLVELRPGPWGDVTCQRITIAPSLEALPRLDRGPNRLVWAFTDTDAAQAADLLARARLSKSQFQGLLTHLQPDIARRGYRLAPDAELVRTLAPHSRRRLYNWLAQSEDNLAIVNAFRFCGPSPGAWLGHAPLAPATRALVEPLIYQNGQVLFFADLPLVLPQIADAKERRRLVRSLAAEATLRLRLHIRPGENVGPLVAYWGQGGRDQDLKQLLQSLARIPGGGSIDVVRLLPPFARTRLYTYPRPEPPPAPGNSRDCHWTSLNFFSTQPDDRFANATQVARVLQHDFRIVSTPRLGDLVVFRSQGQIFHSAVYIADNILFTKNGSRACHPWMLLPLSVMRDFYPQRQAVQVLYLRRRAAPGGGRHV